MTRIALMGLGFMGRTHLGGYAQIENIQIAMICDADEKRLKGDLSGWGNVESIGGEIDLSHAQGTTDWREVIASDQVDVVDICMPTPLHVEIAIAALEAGKHVICEKPVALTLSEAKRVAEAAAASSGYFMPAMVLRFWPEWKWVKEAVDSGRYGAVKGARFARYGSTPPGWYRQPENSGGAMIDLHIHDVDFIYHLFGMPNAVSVLSHQDQDLDHLITRYAFENGPVAVTAEAGWLGESYPFCMRYRVEFENAVADYDVTRDTPLLVTEDKVTVPVSMPGPDGYTHELIYFIECVREGRVPDAMTAEDAVAGLVIAEAERRSIAEKRPVNLTEIESQLETKI